MNAQDRERFVILEQDIIHIKDDVKETKETVKSFNDKMTKITQKLFKDEETGEEGYFALTKKHGVRLTKLENVKVAFIGILMALGTVFGWIANNLLNK